MSTPSSRTSPRAKAGCQDWPFALLFVVNVGVIIALMALWGAKTVTDPDNNSSELLSGDDTKVVVAIAVSMAVVSMALALLMVKLIVAYARAMILFVLWFNVGISFALAAYGFAIGNIFIAIIGALIAMLNLCYARAVQHRIPFAVANLRVAEGAIAKHWSTYIVSVVFTVVQIVWVVIWAMALLGVANQIAEDNPSSSSTTTTSTRSTYKQSGESYVAYFFLLLSFYWGLQVFKNVAHTTVAGTVATFWYNAESSGATGASLKRSTTTSFGSICFGSLIVAFLQALRASGRQDGSALACFAECILGCLQSLMEYFNRWAYVYVGIYGYKFTQAGKAVLQLFKQRGFDAIINDDLIGNVLGFAALGVGLICAGVGALIAETTDAVTFQNSTAFLAILGFVIGIGVAVTPLAVIDSSVATIFVCFAEDPAAFQQSHPELYAPLVQEWHNLYPEIMVQAGYCESRRDYPRRGPAGSYEGRGEEGQGSATHSTSPSRQQLAAHDVGAHHRGGEQLAVDPDGGLDKRPCGLHRVNDRHPHLRRDRAPVALLKTRAVYWVGAGAGRACDEICALHLRETRELRAGQNCWRGRGHDVHQARAAETGRDPCETEDHASRRGVHRAWCHEL
ncbi:unnamed protein product [Phytophthora fragariaefolia]|uniref:Choline transporter-like protein n=1 Tax=Phytophthora fragariaefolia TaxID=1490495 RepID=A0A9W6WMD6_9STRA|nr:unnamed protein product [Phytophthora fragariaefolia]